MGFEDPFSEGFKNNSLFMFLRVLKILESTMCYLKRGLHYYMDPLAFEKFENTIFFKIFKIPSNGQLV